MLIQNEKILIFRKKRVELIDKLGLNADEILKLFPEYADYCELVGK